MRPSIIDLVKIALDDDREGIEDKLQEKGEAPMMKCPKCERVVSKAAPNCKYAECPVKAKQKKQDLDLEDDEDKSPYSREGDDDHSIPQTNYSGEKVASARKGNPIYRIKKRRVNKNRRSMTLEQLLKSREVNQVKVAEERKEMPTLSDALKQLIGGK